MNNSQLLAAQVAFAILSLYDLETDREIRSEMEGETPGYWMVSLHEYNRIPYLIRFIGHQFETTNGQQFYVGEDVNGNLVKAQGCFYTLPFPAALTKEIAAQIKAENFAWASDAVSRHGLTDMSLPLTQMLPGLGSTN
jgi:hypothetical protein